MLFLSCNATFTSLNTPMENIEWIINKYFSSGLLVIFPGKKIIVIKKACCLLCILSIKTMSKWLGLVQRIKYLILYLEYHVPKKWIWIMRVIRIKIKNKKKKCGLTTLFIREHWKDKKDCKDRQYFKNIAINCN